MGPSRTRLAIGALLVLPVVVAACGSGPGSGSTVPLAEQHSTTSTAPTTTTTLPPTTTTTTEEPGWTVIGTDVHGTAVDERTLTGPGGGVVTVVRFRAGTVQFGLHAGSEDPPVGSAIITANTGEGIGPLEAPVLLGAFNGGFKVDAGAGGFYLDGQTLNPLVPGDASFVIDTNGSGHIGVWGQSVPAPGEQVESVRQNLAPLVTGGVADPSVADPSAWGAMLGPGPAVPRSALGEDAAGNILYAGGMSLVPGDLAAGLIGAGAVTAMELDINPEWVQADAAATPGGPLTAMIPGQNRPADQFQAGWTRDFITVLAKS